MLPIFQLNQYLFLFMLAIIFLSYYFISCFLTIFLLTYQLPSQLILVSCLLSNLLSNHLIYYFQIGLFIELKTILQISCTSIPMSYLLLRCLFSVKIPCNLNIVLPKNTYISKIMNQAACRKYASQLYNLHLYTMMLHLQNIFWFYKCIFPSKLYIKHRQFIF